MTQEFFVLIRDNDKSLSGLRVVVPSEVILNDRDTRWVYPIGSAIVLVADRDELQRSLQAAVDGAIEMVKGEQLR